MAQHEPTPEELSRYGLTPEQFARAQARTQAALPAYFAARAEAARNMAAELAARRTGRAEGAQLMALVYHACQLEEAAAPYNTLNLGDTATLRAAAASMRQALGTYENSAAFAAGELRIALRHLEDLAAHPVTDAALAAIQAVLAATTLD